MGLLNWLYIGTDEIKEKDKRNIIYMDPKTINHFYNFYFI